MLQGLSPHSESYITTIVWEMEACNVTDPFPVISVFFVRKTVQVQSVSFSLEKSLSNAKVERFLQTAWTGSKQNLFASE